MNGLVQTGAVSTSIGVHFYSRFFQDNRQWRDYNGSSRSNRSSNKFAVLRKWLNSSQLLNQDI